MEGRNMPEKELGKWRRMCKRIVDSGTKKCERLDSQIAILSSKRIELQDGIGEKINALLVKKANIKLPFMEHDEVMINSTIYQCLYAYPYYDREKNDIFFRACLSHRGTKPLIYIYSSFKEDIFKKYGIEKVLR